MATTRKRDSARQGKTRKIIDHSFYVVFTFDLVGARKPEYQKVQKQLEDIDFGKFILKGKGRPRFRVPNNTFVRRFDEGDLEKSEEVTNHVKQEVDRIFHECSVTGRCFIFVGEGKSSAWDVAWV